MYLSGEVLSLIQMCVLKVYRLSNNVSKCFDYDDDKHICFVCEFSTMSYVSKWHRQVYAVK